MAPLGPFNFSLQAALGFALGELILDTPLSTILVKLTCWLYNRTVAGDYDRTGVFSPPSQFDDNPYAPARATVRLRDPAMVESPTWGTAATIAFCNKLLETIVGLGMFYFLYTRTIQLGAPDPTKIIMLTIMTVVGLSFLIRAGLFMMFLPTTFQRAMALSVLHFTLWLLVSLGVLLIGALVLPFFRIAAGK